MYHPEATLLKDTQLPDNRSAVRAGRQQNPNIWL